MERSWWVLGDFLQTRVGWPWWGFAAVAGVCALTFVWELGEYLGDRVFETALIPSWVDSAVDIFSGSLGGVIGMAVAWLLLRRATRTRAPGT